jgi:hypothetical protein
MYTPGGGAIPDIKPVAALIFACFPKGIFD